MIPAPFTQYWICGGRSATLTAFTPQCLQVSSVTVIQLMLRIHIAFICHRRCIILTQLSLCGTVLCVSLAVGSDNHRLELCRHNTEMEDVTLLPYLKVKEKTGEIVFSPKLTASVMYAFCISSAKRLGMRAISCHISPLNSLPLFQRMRLIGQQEICSLVERASERARERER